MITSAPNEYTVSGSLQITVVKKSEEVSFSECGAAACENRNLMRILRKWSVEGVSRAEGHVSWRLLEIRCEAARVAVWHARGTCTHLNKQPSLRQVHGECDFLASSGYSGGGLGVGQPLPGGHPIESKQVGSDTS